MNNSDKILILNTGGTFSKVYDEILGHLIIPKHNNALEKIFKISKISNIQIDGIIYKDSLDITNQDRKELVDYINSYNYEKIIIIHGTDTMNLTALYLAKKIKHKQIVITGSMKPFSINPIEAVSNLMSAYGFLNSCKKNNIYISMHGLIKKHNKIKKNNKLGIFE